ncbi:transglutaminase family protein [Singulisphaera sp. PoT]|uniref:transglutaminase family protein n=1 Tax=Singulisphaera sp. PoT TaxID=3411797 RepID=UPI003BF5A869
MTHLSARNSPWQDCLESEITVNSQPAVSVPQVDFFGNPVTFFTVQEPHERLEVTAFNRVRIRPRPTPHSDASCNWEAARDVIASGRDAESLDAYQYVFESHYVRHEDELAHYASPSFTPGRPLIDAILDLTRRIHEEFIFDPQATTIETPPRELLKIRRGVCQDFAHFQIACLRSLGLAARYVSGYLLTTPPPGQPRMVGADVSHAWLSVYCPGYGWLDVDPTNNLVVSDLHPTIAWGRDYDDVSPIKGVVLGGGNHTVSVSVDVIAEPDPL